MSKRILYVDPKDNHEKEDDCLVIHPSHLNMASAFESNTFDKIFINNTKTELLRAKGFFNLARALKSKGTLEIIVDQPIAVMQNLDAGEIEANAKLGGFINITTENYQINNNGTKLSTLRLKMIKE
jgi:hypothetical protein